MQKKDRHNRFKNRALKKKPSGAHLLADSLISDSQIQGNAEIPMDIEQDFHEIGVQCSFKEQGNQFRIPILFSSRESNNNASTQTFVPSRLLVINTAQQTCTETKEASCGNAEIRNYKDVACGASSVDIVKPPRVRRLFEDIEAENELKGITGVTFAVFNLLLSFMMEPLNRSGRNKLLSSQNRLLLFLMKMKTGLSSEAMSIIWGVHRTTISATFFEVLDFLCTITQDWIFWPTKSVIKNTMPSSFKEKYKNCRIIIDCTEIKTAKPASIEQQVLLYSNYKGCHTVKFLIGVTPSGFISFVSDTYGGRSTDSFITVDCGLLDLLEKGDEVMSDKGFPQIKTMLDQKNVLLVMPPFSKGSQFSPEEVEETYAVASVRIHVERSIQRVKLFKILDKIPRELLPYIDKIIHMACVLANLQKPILKS